MGECEFPDSPSDIISWAKTLRGTGPVPEWVFDVITILRENEAEVVIKDTGTIRECQTLSN